MGIAKDFNKLVHDQIRVHAAWLPVTNTFQVGDFGVISEGVFVRMGNIRSDFGVDFQTQPGAQSDLDFKSERVRVFRLTAGAEVNVFPDEPLAAKLRIEFERANSFMLKASVTVQEMSSVFDAARRLATQQAWDEGKFKCVAATFTGENAIVLSSRSNNTVFEIGGKADALKKLELGNAEAELTFSGNSSLGLEVIGRTGVVGLRLFQVKKKSGQAEVLRGAPLGPDAVDVVQSEQMQADLPDDL